MSRLRILLILVTLALIPALGKTQGEKRLQSAGFWTKESTTYVYQFQLDVPLQPGSQGQIVWTLKQSPKENERAKIGRQAIEYVRVDYYRPDGSMGLTGTSKSDPYGVIGVDIYRLQVSSNLSEVYGSTFAHGGWSGRIESRADQIPSQLAKAGYMGSPDHQAAQSRPQDQPNFCEQTRHSACTSSDANSKARAYCAIAVEGCDKVASRLDSSVDKVMFRSACSVELKNLEARTDAPGKVLARYKYSETEATFDGVNDVANKMMKSEYVADKLYGGVLKFMYGPIAHGVKQGKGAEACVPDYERACLSAASTIAAQCSAR